MIKAPLGRWVAGWLLILVLAVANGILREAVLVPSLGRTGGYLASGSILSALVVGVAIALARWLALVSTGRALALGALWLALTLVFEFGFGLVQGESWPEMLAQYTFKNGNIWPVVLAVVFFAPLIACRARGREKK